MIDVCNGLIYGPGFIGSQTIVTLVVLGVAGHHGEPCLIGSDLGRVRGVARVTDGSEIPE